MPAYLDTNLKDVKLKKVWQEAANKWSQLEQSKLFFILFLHFLTFLTIFSNFFLIFKDSKDAVLIYVIHGVLKPSKISKNGKSTIAESQESVIKFIDSDVEANLYTGQPPFILVKKNLYSIEKIWIVTDQIIYESESVAKALSSCFMIYHIFNLNYNQNSINFWLFIQKIIFKLNFKTDVVGSSYRTLASYFNGN